MKRKKLSLNFPKSAMKRIDFVKAVGSGNDFVIVDNRKACLSVADFSFSDFTKKVCLRRRSIGADGVLVLEDSKIADVRMRVFNPDGREAEMCGNGARCVALYNSKYPRENRRFSGTQSSEFQRNSKGQIAKTKNIKIETKAGVLEAEIIGENRLKLRMSEPVDIELDFNLEVNGRNYRVSFINTGVPHAVLFVDDIEGVDVVKLGSDIRGHIRFQPAGTNVDFVKKIDSRNIEIRTYERGVEDETLACGTGAVAAAIIAAYDLLSFAKAAEGRQLTTSNHKISVLTRSQETLQVCFNRESDRISEVWLEGGAEIAYEGQIGLPLA